MALRKFASRLATSRFSTTTTAAAGLFSPNVKFPRMIFENSFHPNSTEVSVSLLVVHSSRLPLPVCSFGCFYKGVIDCTAAGFDVRPTASPQATSTSSCNKTFVHGVVGGTFSKYL